MKIHLNILKALLTCSGVLFIFLYCHAQLPTYTVDENFNTNNLFRDGSGVNDLYFLEDGRILVGGGFDGEWFTPSFSGLGMLWEDGSADETWAAYTSVGVLQLIAQSDGYTYPYIQSMGKVGLDGTPWYFLTGDWWSDYNEGGNTNPYTVESVWTIYQQDDGKLLIGGAIATDTLQPSLFRCISRLNADGTHDPTFPALEPSPNNSNTYVKNIHRASNGYWYISGAFEAINGHETHHIARLTPNFEVDQTFVSPFIFEGLNAFQPELVLLDSQDRLWVSGEKVRFIDNPNDTLQVVRLLPDGSLDPNFTPRYLDAEYPDELIPWIREIELRGVVELQNHSEKFLLYGYFNRINGVPQECISVMDDEGVIQSNFFQGQGATINDWNNLPMVPAWVPSIGKVEELDNGDLLIGGAFSQFMGSTHYNMVKLNLGVINSVAENELDRKFQVYPNPSSDYLNISFEDLQSGVVRIMNSHGQELNVYQMNGESLRLDVGHLAKGLYFVMLETWDIAVTRKFIKN